MNNPSSTSGRAMRGAGWIAVSSALLLSACGGMCEPRIETVETKVPIIVPCAVAVPKEPDWELKKLPPDADEFATAKAMRADLRLHEQYELELKAAAAGCAKK